MRLTSKELESIKNIVREELKAPYELKLFGSRVDENKRGGDIDLLIICSCENFNDNRARKYEILNKIYASIGDQKIDILFTTKEILEKDVFLSSLRGISLEIT